jgi:hypothetical protein
LGWLIIVELAEMPDDDNHRMYDSNSQVTRSEFLGFVAAAAVAALGLRTFAQTGGSEPRIADVIRDYDAQGFHRTATTVDDVSAKWLVEQVAFAGAKAGLERFPLERVDVTGAYLEADGRRIDGLPLFDGTFTDPRGVDGPLGISSAAIVLTTVGPAAISEEGRSIAALRRSPGVRALVAVTKGARPGLVPMNAAEFASPYGVPVLQVGSEYAGWLDELTTAGRSVRVVAAASRTRTTAANVITRVAGQREDLSPVVVITPRSGWWHCAGERGGGLACWLEAIRAAASTPAPRPVWFLASSGHELGHLGLDHFFHQRESMIKGAAAWMHLGANIGAAGGAARLQASDDAIAVMAVDALKQAGAALDRQVPRGTVPAGEARNIHVGGGRYVSLLGTSPYFHSVADRFPDAVDVPAVARYAAAVGRLLTQMRQA